MKLTSSLSQLILVCILVSLCSLELNLVNEETLVSTSNTNDPPATKSATNSYNAGNQEYEGRKELFAKRMELEREALRKRQRDMTEMLAEAKRRSSETLSQIKERLKSTHDISKGSIDKIKQLSQKFSKQPDVEQTSNSAKTEIKSENLISNSILSTSPTNNIQSINISENSESINVVDTLTTTDSYEVAIDSDTIPGHNFTDLYAEEKAFDPASVKLKALTTSSDFESNDLQTIAYFDVQLPEEKRDFEEHNNGTDVHRGLDGPYTSASVNNINSKLENDIALSSTNPVANTAAILSLENNADILTQDLSVSPEKDSVNNINNLSINSVDLNEDVEKNRAIESIDILVNASSTSTDDMLITSQLANSSHNEEVIDDRIRPTDIEFENPNENTVSEKHHFSNVFEGQDKDTLPDSIIPDNLASFNIDPDISNITDGLLLTEAKSSPFSQNEDPLNVDAVISITSFSDIEKNDEGIANPEAFLSELKNFLAESAIKNNEGHLKSNNEHNKPNFISEMDINDY